MPTLTTRDGEPILVLNAVPIREGGTGARDAATARRNLGITLTALGGVTDHGALTGLVPDDDHTQYALLAGRAGGQTLVGGTGASDLLTLRGNTNAAATPQGIQIIVSDSLANNLLIVKSIDGTKTPVTWGANGALLIIDSGAHVGSSTLLLSLNCSNLTGTASNPALRVQRNTTDAVRLHFGGYIELFSDNILSSAEPAGTGVRIGSRISGGATKGPLFDLSTKAFAIDISGATAAKICILTSSHTADRTITLPNATTTLAGLSVVNTFTIRQVISVAPGSDRHLWLYDSTNAAYGSFRANLTGGIDRAYETPNSDGTLLVFTDGTGGQQPDAGQLVYGAGPNLPMTAGAALTSGRVPFATTGGVLTDDADMTFNADTLTVTKLVVGGGTSIAKIETGTYTPTRSAEANLDSNITPSQAQYVRVGNIVTVSGRFTADPTAPATTTSFEFTLPVASNIGAAEDLAGVAFCGAIAGQGAAIVGSVANDTAVFTWKAADVTSQLWSYTFTYEVI